VPLFHAFSVIKKYGFSFLIFFLSLITEVFFPFRFASFISSLVFVRPSCEPVMLVNPALSKDSSKEGLSSNDMEKVLELQNSVMFRRRLSNFAFPGFGFRPDMYSDDREVVYEQQKLLQTFLKHYQTSLIEESSWMNPMLYPKRPEEVKEDEEKREENRKKYRRDEEGKVIMK